MQTSLDPYDAVLLLSFGGPEAPEEVMPFLRRVTAGRGIPDERLEQVGEHYHQLGGRSPINDQNRALLAELGAERGDERAVLLVDGAPAAELVVVLPHLLEALVRDAASGGDPAQEGQDLLWRLGSPEAQ